MKTCDLCKGSGKGGWFVFSGDCPRCDGTGSVDDGDSTYHDNNNSYGYGDGSGYDNF